MLNATGPFGRMTRILLLCLTATLSSCASAVPYYFNNDERLIVDVAGDHKPLTVVCHEGGQICEREAFPIVCMSQGQYRVITTADVIPHPPDVVQPNN